MQTVLDVKALCEKSPKSTKMLQLQSLSDAAVLRKYSLIALKYNLSITLNKYWQNQEDKSL